MTLGQFLRDRRGPITIRLASVAIVAIAVTALSRNVAIGVLVTGVLLAGLAAALAVEYLPRRRYYAELERTIAALDRTNLMAEVVGDPHFLEGRIVHEALREANKSMLESIAEYRRREKGYREYIELWIHEIKTPIASARLVAENDPGAAADAMLAEVERIEDLVEQTLFYSRSTSVEKDFLVREVPLTAVVNPALRRAARSFIERKIALEIDGLELSVYTDVKWATFIVGQVLANAVAYAPAEQPTISIRAARAAQSVVLTIKDNGCGILAGELPRVFDKGFTGTNGRRNTKSTGLGLYLVNKLADRIELGVSIDSAADQGTTVTLVFPQLT